MLSNDAVLGAIAAGFLLIIFVFRGMATRFFDAIDAQKKENIDLKARLAALEKTSGEALAELGRSREREDFERNAKVRAMFDTDQAIKQRDAAINDLAGSSSENEKLMLERSRMEARLDAQAKVQQDRDKEAADNLTELRQSLEDYKTRSGEALIAETEKRVKAEGGEADMKLERDQAIQQLAEMKESMQKQIDHLTRDMDILKNKTGEMPERSDTGSIAGKTDTGPDAGKDKDHVE